MRRRNLGLIALARAFILLCALVWRFSSGPKGTIFSDAKIKSMNVDNGRTRVVYQSNRSLEDLAKAADRELKEPTWTRVAQSPATFGVRDIDYFTVEGSQETTIMLTERKEGGTYISLLTPQGMTDGVKLSLFKLLAWKRP